MYIAKKYIFFCISSHALKRHFHFAVVAPFLHTYVVSKKKLFNVVCYVRCNISMVKTVIRIRFFSQTMHAKRKIQSCFGL